jgi:hypothetical protein
MMPTKYIVLIVGGNQKDNTLVRILTSRITKMEKLEDKMKTAKTIGIQ